MDAEIFQLTIIFCGKDEIWKLIVQFRRQNSVGKPHLQVSVFFVLFLIHKEVLVYAFYCCLWPHLGDFIPLTPAQKNEGNLLGWTESETCRVEDLRPEEEKMDGVSA